MNRDDLYGPLKPTHYELGDIFMIDDTPTTIVSIVDGQIFVDWFEGGILNRARFLSDGSPSPFVAR